MPTCLSKFVCGVDSMVKLKSKITVVNNVSGFADFLRMGKLDDGFYLSLENLQEVLVSSGSYSNSSNFDLECLEEVTVSELKESLKG